MYKGVLKLFVLSMFFSQNVGATNLEISPLRVELNNKNPLSSLTIYNKDKNISLIEADVYKWKQKDGIIENGITLIPQDYLEKITNEGNIALFPLKTVIKDNSEQTIRVKLTKNKINENHQEYRVLLKEQENPLMNNNDISFLTTFSLPMFLYDEIKSEKEFMDSIKIKKFEKDNLYYVEIKNTNNQTIKLIEATTDKTEVLGYYLLPNIKSYLSINKEADSINLKTDKGVFEFKI